MRRVLPFLSSTILVLGCSTDAPFEPAAAPDLHARLTAAPDLSGKLPQLERRVFIHYRPGYEHKPKHNPGGGGPEGGGGGSSNCYSVLAKGASWKTTEPYRTTFEPLPRVTTWEFDEHDIFGVKEGGTVPPFTGDLDGYNTAQLGPYPNENVIAVTVVWGVFIGPPSQRYLAEWDILMNTQFSFGDVTNHNQDIMDTENVSAHELGHAAGLGHPADGCTEETMYAFAAVGETKKRTLEAGDKAGIRELY